MSPARGEAECAGAVPEPRLVRGVGFVVDGTGATTRAERPVVALCRCGGTGRPPWCDGTHKVLAERLRSRATPA